MGAIGTLGKLAVKVVKAAEDKAASAASLAVKKAPPAGRTFWHGSHSSAPSFQITDEDPSHIFPGIFGAGRPAALSHGTNLYKVAVPEDKILSNYDLNYEIPHEKVAKILRKLHPRGDPDLAHHLIVEDGDIYASDPAEIRKIFGTSDLGDAGWAAQAAKGRLARELGYEAVQTSDEHGSGTHLIIKGTLAKVAEDAVEGAIGTVAKARGGRVSPFKVKR